MLMKNTPEERARRYRDRAARLVQMSHHATTAELKATCLSLASSWQELAVSTERRVDAIPLERS